MTSSTLETTAGTAKSPPAKRLMAVVGYDGTQPARRALDRAGELLRSREGAIEVVYVARVPAGIALSAGAMGEVIRTFDDQTAALAKEVRDRLLGQDHPWHFQRRDGAVPAELMAVARELRDQYGDTAEIVIVVGGSEHWYHHLAGSVGTGVVQPDRFSVLVVP